MSKLYEFANILKEVELYNLLLLAVLSQRLLKRLMATLITLIFCPFTAVLAFLYGCRSVLCYWKQIQNPEPSPLLTMFLNRNGDNNLINAILNFLPAKRPEKNNLDENTESESIKIVTSNMARDSHTTLEQVMNKNSSFANEVEANNNAKKG